MSQVQLESPATLVLTGSSTVANPFKHDDNWWEDVYAAPTYSGKGKGIELAVVQEEDERTSFDDLFDGSDVVQWKHCQPPAGLQWVAEVESETVKRVIVDSVDRVRERIRREEEQAEQQRQEAVAELARFQEKEQEKREEEPSKAAEQAAASRQETLAPANADLKLAAPLAYTASQRQPYVLAKRTLRKDIPAELRSLSSSNTTSKPRKQRNRSLFSLLWKSNSPDRAETSAAGKARSRQYGGHYGLTSSSRSRTEGHHSTFPVVNAEAECVSCLDDFKVKDMIKAPCHHYCTDCFERLISTACENEQQWPAKCCLNNIPDETITSVIRGELLERWRNRGWEWDIPVSNRIYCSQPACGAWCRPHEIDRAQNLAICHDRHRTCTFCRGPHHGNDTCPQDPELARTNELAEEQGWKRCYGCNAFVEHREACQHMTCRCGAEFCYVCGAPWRTCQCTMDHLAAVKAQADQRRMQRQAREAEQEAELQEMLRQIEEYEREEALKAELLRQEQDRIAEERRQRELEERIRREQARRQDIIAKFQDLRQSFGKIHELQRSMTADAHSQEEREITADNAAKAAELRDRHKAKRENLLASAENRLRVYQAALEAEYAARLADERHLEDQYAAQLKLYWTGKRNGQEQLEAALRVFRKKMDLGFQTWTKWMDNKLETYRWKVHEEKTIQIEHMANAERKLRDIGRAALTAYMHRRAGQLRWIDVIINERQIMLREMENGEIENGEDIDVWFAEAALDKDSLAAAAAAVGVAGSSAGTAGGSSNAGGRRTGPGHSIGVHVSDDGMNNLRVPGAFVH